MCQNLIDEIKAIYPAHAFVPLHAPVFDGNEKAYLVDCIDTTFVSSVGAYVDRFERLMCEITGAKHAIAVVNGTCALHIAMVAAGVKAGDEVITQPLTFVATCNAIAHCGAKPVFVDVDETTMGMSAHALKTFLQQQTEMRNGICYNKKNGKRIAACVPMHTYGHPCEIEEICRLCSAYGISVIEDAAESIGSYVEGRHTGTFGLMGTFSFNGNKTVTAGGGGAVVTNDSALAKRLKHLTTTAKKAHAWFFDHDEVGYNYRMPNINAALACAQLEKLPEILKKKRELASYYQKCCAALGYTFMVEPKGTTSNYWLNTIQVKDKAARDTFLERANAQGVQVRPTWTLMTHLPMYKNAMNGRYPVAEHLADTLINIPSSIDFTI